MTVAGISVAGILDSLLDTDILVADILDTGKLV